MSVVGYKLRSVVVEVGRVVEVWTMAEVNAKTTMRSVHTTYRSSHTRVMPVDVTAADSESARESVRRVGAGGVGNGQQPKYERGNAKAFEEACH